jgi:hypothetical protein
MEVRNDIIELSHKFNKLGNSFTEAMSNIVVLDDVEYMMDRYDKSRVIVDGLNSTRSEIKALCNNDVDLLQLYIMLSKLISLEDYNGALDIRRQIEEYAC